MILVTATDLVQWADTRSCEDQLPLLVRRLIFASIDRVDHVSVPAGDSVFQPGWDGRLNATEADWPVPEQQSAWEFGKGKSVVAKADDDFGKRTQDPRGLNPAETTFVFVSPRRWPGGPDEKTAWAKRRAEEGQWRKVVALDADDLETWLENCPAVACWFAQLIGKNPEAIEGLDTFWQRSISDTDPELTPEVILAGRETLCSAINEWAEGDDPILRVKADTREEAVLLLAAWARREHGLAEEFLFANAVVVHRSEAWRQLSAANRSHILIPLFTDGSLGLGDLSERGKWIFVPSGWDAAEATNIVIAPWLERHPLQIALKNAGVDGAEAYRVSGNCGRSLQVLTRILSRAPERQSPPWATHEQAQALVPLLLAGRWRSSRKADRAIISRLAGVSYESVEAALNRWLFVQQAPVRKYGDAYILTSPLDAWSQLGKHVTKQAWERYGELLIELLSQRDPSLDLPPDQRWMAPVHGLEFNESREIREGLAEQLARLVGAEDRLKLGAHPSAEAVAERVLTKSLSPPDDIEKWLSIGSLVPILAEAAPETFLDCLEGLLMNDAAASQLFGEENFLSATPAHVYVEFAIESIRWFSPCLTRCADALVKLSAYDPGSNSEPRPASTFNETFLVYKPANNLPFSKQLLLLKSLGTKYPTAAWPLILRLLPRPTWLRAKHGPKCRAADLNPDIPRTSDELDNRIGELLGLLIELAGDQVDKWVDLFDSFDHLHAEARSTVMQVLGSICANVGRESVKVAPLYQRLMDIVRRHRVHSDKKWALPLKEINKLESLAADIKPTDPVELHRWLFRDQYLSGEFGGDDKALEKMRTVAVEDIFAAKGIVGLEQLANLTRFSGLIGEAVGRSGLSEDQKKQCLLYFLGRTDASSESLSRWLVSSLYSSEGVEIGTFVKRHGSDLNGTQFGRFAQGLPRGTKTWALVKQRGHDADSAYWKGVGVYIGDETQEVIEAVQALFRHGMSRAAIEVARLARCPVPSDLLIEALEHTLQFFEEGSDIVANDIHFAISGLFDKLDQNSDTSLEMVVHLELQFLPLLKDSNRGLSAIKRHLLDSPQFFVELLRWQYKREDRGEDEDLKNLSRDRAKYLWHCAFDILHDFNSIPGLESDGAETPKILLSWTEQAIQSAALVKRKGVAESNIGSALARAPDKESMPWPPDAICDLMEHLWSDSLESGFYCGALNKLGVREVKEGEPDAKLSKQYEGWAAHRQISHPRVSRVLRRLSKHFLSEANSQRAKADFRKQME